MQSFVAFRLWLKGCSQYYRHELTRDVEGQELLDIGRLAHAMFDLVATPQRFIQNNEPAGRANFRADGYPRAGVHLNGMGPDVFTCTEKPDLISSVVNG
nr:hypothetical protein [Bradyrhizobium sp. BRP19]